jgi:hypothetical protein
VTQLAFAAPIAATDSRTDPAVPAFLAKINDDSCPFREVPRLA